jgi:hypothetical protein
MTESGRLRQGWFIDIPGGGTDRMNGAKEREFFLSCYFCQLFGSEPSANSGFEYVQESRLKNRIHCDYWMRRSELASRDD